MIGRVKEERKERPNLNMTSGQVHCVILQYKSAADPYWNGLNASSLRVDHRVVIVMEGEQCYNGRRERCMRARKDSSRWIKI